METVLRAILPASAVVAEAFGEVDAELLPEEAALLGSAAVEKRRREFTAGRSLARRALQELGAEPVAILTGPSRQPLWPAGVVGSITHCAGYTAAAVAFATKLDAIGIDAEVHEPLPPEVIDVVARREEREWMSAHRDAIHWDRVLFSAKESVFKAWFPLTQRWLEFDDVSIVFDPSTRTFRATPLGIAGRYLLHGNHVLTAVTMERRE